MRRLCCGACGVPWRRRRRSTPGDNRAMPRQRRGSQLHTPLQKRRHTERIPQRSAPMPVLPVGIQRMQTAVTIWMSSLPAVVPAAAAAAAAMPTSLAAAKAGTGCGLDCSTACSTLLGRSWHLKQLEVNATAESHRQISRCPREVGFNRYVAGLEPPPSRHSHAKIRWLLSSSPNGRNLLPFQAFNPLGRPPSAPGAWIGNAVATLHVNGSRIPDVGVFHLPGAGRCQRQAPGLG